MSHADAEELIEEPDRERSGPPGRRTLDRDRILTEAIVYIDEYGLSQLTMRKLGAHLGVEAMALYRYVPGREQLLDGVVDLLMDELYADTLAAPVPGAWQDFLQQSAHGVRRLAAAHPRIFPLVATRPPAAPWLRPPLRSLRWVETFLTRLREYDFTPAATVVVYRAFATYLLGQLLLEVAGLTGESIFLPGQRVSGGTTSESDELSDYPRISELAELLKQDRFDEEFEDSLEDLINRVGLLRD